jgi:hypothetical protein
VPGIAASLVSRSHDSHPQDWSPVKTTWFGRPDLAGTHYLGAEVDNDASRVLGSADLFVRLMGRQASRMS